MFLSVRHEVVVPSRIDPTGRSGPSRHDVRTRRWRRVGPGLFVPHETDSSALPQRVVEVAAGLPRGCGITGRAALSWSGAAYLDLDPSSPDGGLIDVAVDDATTLRPRPGVRLTRDWLFEGDVIDVGGIPVTRPLRSVTFAARRAFSLESAVQTIDMAARADLVSLIELERYTRSLPARPGVKQLRLAVGVADENSQSPLETTMRLRWFEATGRRPLTNRPIFDLQGRHLLTPDLIDEEYGIVGEYDGETHASADGRGRDQRRDRLCRLHELVVVRMDRRDLRTTRLESTLWRLYDGALAQPATARTWTLRPPPGWVDTTTVLGRRALPPHLRSLVGGWWSP